MTGMHRSARAVGYRSSVASSGYHSVPININSQSDVPAKDDRFWDVFEMDGPSDVRRGMRTYIWCIRVLKVVVYILLNLSLVLCTVGQRLTLLTLIPQGKSLDKYQCHLNGTFSASLTERLSNNLLLCLGICLPYMLVFLTGLWKYLFGKTEQPSVLLTLKVLVLETIPTAGIAFFVYIMLPNFNMITGTAVLNACCLLPGVLNMVSRFNCINTEPMQVTSLRTWMPRLLDGVALLLQLGFIPYMYLTDVYLSDHAADMIGLMLTIAACSFMCWENFFEDFECLNKRIKITDKNRPFLMMVSSVIKISVTFVISVTATSKDLGNYKDILPNAFRNLWAERMFFDSYFLGFIFSSFIGYHVAYTACKLNMQIFSFSIPLLITTPTSLLFHYLNAETKIPVFDLQRLNTVCEFSTHWQDYMPYLLILSLYWIGRHVWTPHMERMAKIEALFVAPTYCGVLFEQHLVLNRRRHDQKMGKSPESLYMNNIHLEEGQTEKSSKEQSITKPVIYACATLWHETPREMTQLMKSLFVMDLDFSTRQAADDSSVETYEFESHILFDDSFEYDEGDRRVPNKFVKQFVGLLTDAASAAHGTKIEIDDPVKIETPYGGQLVYGLPGGSLLYVHLKDKNLIRHRKRWSQVMYMYYLLGFRIGQNIDSKKDKSITDISRLVFQKTFNTFILALDGDVDFTPDAVRMLLDKMRKNHQVGASCGRIYPIGNGPMVWYQKFEYAVAHWLQKSTEHVLGCVLCSPGCFSLFRGSALTDKNIMRKYTILPSEAVHHLMYDQGEDRWLCTLLLKGGYRVDYAAAADAYTFAPEGFDEFFNQRRRWMPSTMANIIDLLQDSNDTVKRNDNISRLYILYQGTLMLSTMIGPATVLMMIAGAILTVFQVELMQSYLISCLPAAAFFFLCFWVPQKLQLFLAKLLSAFYMLIMTVVLVGCIVTAVEENPFHPSVIFLAGLMLIFIFAGILHPMDLGCLMLGTLYFIGLPMGFLLLVIYSLCNLHVVSWGTREVSSVNKSKKELEEEAEQARQNELNRSRGFFARFFPDVQVLTLLEEWRQKKKKDDETATIIKELSLKIDNLVNALGTKKSHTGVMSPSTNNSQNSTNTEESDFKNNTRTINHAARHPRNTPHWTTLKWLGSDQGMELQAPEKKFWEEFIEKYLAPLDANSKIQKENQDKLLDLRNGVCGGISVINVIWIAVNFMFQLRGPGLVSIPIPSLWGGEDQRQEYLQVDVIGISFVLFFMILMLIQFCGMVMHRWGTMLHLLAFTELIWPWSKPALEEKREQFLTELSEGNKLQHQYESIRDLSKSEKREKLKEIIKHIQNNGTKPVETTPNKSIAERTKILNQTLRARKNTFNQPEVGTADYNLRMTISQVRKRLGKSGLQNDPYDPIPDYD
ncbi:chitin synthase chs-2-like [Ylistrum balloti]|uniref:chitin synthase chs-2-like n=1 Tax=Ylistrum balloti TaxID=509963 RepID=UPI002905B8D6|nr:chitin synthase chs-2-like [Ylistrum balloti]